MTKLRHIALIVEDLAASAKFFEEAFGMKNVEEVPGICRMSDGMISVALLQKETEEERVGIDHFGLWVEDMDTAKGQAMAAGAVSAEIQPAAGAYYEVKLRTPDGIDFDLSQQGWPGASLGPSSE